MKDATTARQRICWFIETVSEPTFVVDPSGCIAMANAHAHELFGYASGELDGVEIETLIPVASRDRHRELRHDYQRDPRDRSMGGNLRIEALRKDGSKFHADIELRARGTEQGPVTIAVIRDLTPQDLEESVHEIQDLERRLRLVRIAGEDASALIDNTIEVLTAAETRMNSERTLPLIAEARRVASRAGDAVVELLRYADIGERKTPVDTNDRQEPTGKTR